MRIRLFFASLSLLWAPILAAFAPVMRHFRWVLFGDLDHPPTLPPASAPATRWVEGYDLHLARVDIVWPDGRLDVRTECKTSRLVCFADVRGAHRPQVGDLVVVQTDPGGIAWPVAWVPEIEGPVTTAPAPRLEVN